MVTTRQMEKQIAGLKKAKAKEEHRRKLKAELFQLKHRKKIAVARGAGKAMGYAGRGAVGVLQGLGERMEASRKSKGRKGYF